MSWVDHVRREGIARAGGVFREVKTGKVVLGEGGAQGRYGLICAQRRAIWGLGGSGNGEGGGGAYKDVHFLVEPIVEEQVVAHPDACAHPQSPS